MPRRFKISTNPLRRFRVYGKRIAASTLAFDAERVVAAILMEVPDLESGNLCASQESTVISNSLLFPNRLLLFYYSPLLVYPLRDKRDYHVLEEVSRGVGWRVPS